MTQNPLLSAEQLYDGQGRHLGGVYPPLLVDNELTEAFHENKAARPVADCLYLQIDDEEGELGLVWMLPLGMTRETPVPPDIAAAVVHVVDSQKMVMVHGDDVNILVRIRAMVESFVGGGHA